MDPTQWSVLHLERVQQMLKYIHCHDSFLNSQTSSASSRMDKNCDEADNADEFGRFRIFNIPIGDAKLRARYKKMQSACYNFLERPCGVLSVSYHFSVFGLVVIGLVLAVLNTMEGFQDDGFQLGIYMLEVFLLIIFTLEYVLRMWSAGCRSTYVGVLGRIRFAFKPFVIVDLIVIGSTSAVIMSSSRSNLSSAVSVLRFFQVLRMVRFDRQGGSWKLLGSVLFLHRQELMTTFYIGFCSLIFASFFVFQAEMKGNSEEFGTFADSFWWGIVTLTTVGYGDKVPKSWAGRGVAAFFAIMGISFFALPAGILGSGFALKVSHQQRQKHAKRRRRPAAMLIQCNWRYYASRKDSKLVATWLPYIKYLQEVNSTKEGRNLRKDESKETGTFERANQFVGRARKISIFGRKSSDSASLSANEPYRLPKNKSLGTGLFPSSDSLQDPPSYSSVDQHTDDENAANSAAPSAIIVSDPDGNLSLPQAYKQSIRFTRYLKFLVALRKFKLAKKPYDVKDVIEQYSTGHVELLGKVKGIGNNTTILHLFNLVFDNRQILHTDFNQSNALLDPPFTRKILWQALNKRIDEALGFKSEKNNENPSRYNVIHRLSKLEKQVKTLDSKLDTVISLLEKSDNKDSLTVKAPIETSTVPLCTACRKHAENNSRECSLPSPSASQVTEELGTPVRRRKFALSLTPRLNESRDRFQERKETTDGKSDSENSFPRIETCLNDIHSESTARDQSEHGTTNDNYLSPKPFGCESYDLRSRSDSAFSSVCSEYKKANDCQSPGDSPDASDSEYASSNGTIVGPRDKNSDVGTSAKSSPCFSETTLQETRM